MRYYFILFVLVFATTTTAQITNTEPSKAELVTSDIENFWRAYDQAAKLKDPALREAVFESEYINKGSIGLKGFIPHRIVSAKALVRQIDRYPRFYASIRTETGKVGSMKPGIYKSFRNLDEIYPNAVFPKRLFCNWKDQFRWNDFVERPPDRNRDALPFQVHSYG